MENFFNFLMHLIFFLSFVVGLGRKIDEVKNDEGSRFVHNSDFGGRYKYLTSLDMVIISSFIFRHNFETLFFSSYFN